MKQLVFIYLILALLDGLWTETAYAADDHPNTSRVYKAIIGVCLHDYGPTSDYNENGVDPNLEFQFNLPRWKNLLRIGSPYLMAGATPNFSGDTSVVYGGFTYELDLSNVLAKNFFVSAGLSAALHSGPLHKDEVGCKEESDCGFGNRILPRVNVELGAYFIEKHGLSLFYDHMSHGYLLSGENEGIDHIGIRYHYRFSN